MPNLLAMSFEGELTPSFDLGFLQPGAKESHIDKKILELVEAQFGTRKYWHKRLVRTGANTIHPIWFDTPDRVIESNDIAFIDLGPVFGNLEADFARTYVIGG